MNDLEEIELKKDFIEKMFELDEVLAQVDGAKFGDDCAPLRHIFGDGIYIREITMPKGMLVTSKLHKTTHPYFVLKGDVSVETETGTVRIKAPYWGITKAGTKRILYIHEETIWVTVHATKETDLKKIEKELIADSYNNLLEHLNRRKVLLCHLQR